MREYTLFGTNIQNSMSPILHNYSINKNELDAEYTLTDIISDNFDKIVKKKLNEDNFYGFNITIPFKKRIFDHIHHIDDNVKSCGAVNCGVKINNEWYGHNTDIYGFTRAFTEDVKDKNLRIGIMGAGGSARAILVSLRKIGFKNIFLYNRTNKNAKIMLNEIKFNEVEVLNSFEYLEKCNILINCTPLREMIFSPEILKNIDVFYDLNYYDINSDFVRYLENNAVQYFNGWKMLVYQAMESFKIWFNLSQTVDELLVLYYNRSKE